jgi:hypothetical protein
LLTDPNQLRRVIDLNQLRRVIDLNQLRRVIDLNQLRRVMLEGQSQQSNRLKEESYRPTKLISHLLLVLRVLKTKKLLRANLDLHLPSNL